MMEEAGLGICVIGKEGVWRTMGKADVVVTDILDALDFLLNPFAIKAPSADNKVRSN
jgi:soluble P-type ATPase